MAEVEKGTNPGEGGTPSGDGDSFAIGPGVVGGHRFVVGRLRNGKIEPDPQHPRLNPYEAFFRRKGVALKPGPTPDQATHPDGRKPPKFPQLPPDMGFNDAFLAKWVRKYDESQPRDDQGQWTSTGGGYPGPSRLMDTDNEPIHPDTLKIKLKDINGEAIISPDGQAYGGSPTDPKSHLQIAAALGSNVSSLVSHGWIRARVDSSSVGLEMDIKDAKAVSNAVAILREHRKADFIIIDPPLHDKNKPFQAGNVGEAIRWLQDAPQWPVHKYSEDQPRDDQGQWTSSASPKIYMRPEELKPYEGGRWQHPKHGILSGPLAPEQVPDTLYHVTTNKPAVEASGMLKGQHDAGGLGGGNNMAGVSFTTSKADADHIERALRREVAMAHLPVGDRKAVQDALTQYAREDEVKASLPAGSLDPAVDFAMHNFDANEPMRRLAFNDATHEYDTPRTPEEYESRDRSGRHEAHAQYNQLRESKAREALGVGYQEWKTHPSQQWTKNPLILSSDASKIKPENIGTFAIPKGNIPQGALVRPGSDDFLSEIRVHSDVPLKAQRRVVYNSLDLTPALVSIERSVGTDGKERFGKAFEMAARYAVNHADSILVHGTITINGEIFKHAWVEFTTEELVYDGAQGKFYKTADFVEALDPDVDESYYQSEARAKIQERKNWGPWT